ncbi:MAG: bifunctional tRNA (5-methylaminomethyl-2-thiouridine)(34)-methyltransferase MnmD/FAD-dependent 5-carboxymethylaminomethyl-2-thiouridine(34) oxidoreductase MnmC [Zoogloeaceae bacterium]|jgi:tRNA 5-methylaminomethyl-2-thiouridine biosynthesis bifunctional protein|nr:bifunctional tRNA (5-methylaminomethyl-2-thiouridine)(34)-methyltransferase MnmD/FAD-dependent 5-carboxymethylaminomethyl-2-thiouridine(34) oxidoreductase MnmC [Zoogloeaceae bacterium]
MPSLKTPTLAFTEDGTPMLPDYGDVYHARQGGLAQAEHVFLHGNGLPHRWQGRARFVILETGFGLGLNFLATWAAWATDPTACESLHFVSVEKHPLTCDDLACAHQRLFAGHPALGKLAAQLRAHWPPPLPGLHRRTFADDRLILTLVLGDARTELPRLMLEADAIYADGFAPDKNPELWSPEIVRALRRLAAPGATLATWSVAGAFRRLLAEHEFAVHKAPGFGGKRQMLKAQFVSRKPRRFQMPPADERSALVLGAGAAGTSVAAALARRGWQVVVLDRHAQPGEGASGNLAGVLRPLPSADDNFLSRLTRAGFLATLTHLRALHQAGLPVRYDQPGALHIARDAAHAIQMQKAAARFPEAFVRWLTAAEASALLRWPVAHGGWLFPDGGWVSPVSLCRANVAACPTIRFVGNTEVATLQRTKTRWQALAADGALLAEAACAVFACGIDAPSFAPLAWLPQRPARGQVTWLPADALPAPPALIPLVCGSGYLTPEVDGLRLAGASFLIDDLGRELRLNEQQDNLGKLDALLPGIRQRLADLPLTGRVGHRPMSPDRLPIVGAVPDPLGKPGRFARRLPGLWCCQGFGSRGIVWSALMADLLASQMHGDPLPLPFDLTCATDPARFLK